MADDGVDDLAQIVRRYVRGHSDRDPGRAVDQQVRQLGGQDRWLLQTAVEVVDPVDRVLVQVVQHLLGHLVQAAFGVPHGRRFVAVDRTEVALPVDERVTQRELLGHADHRIVDRRVAVRMVLPQRFSDHPGALLMRLVGGEPHVVHRVQDAAMHRLQAVPDVRERPDDDDAHGVVDVALLHLLLDGPVDDLVSEDRISRRLLRILDRCHQPCAHLRCPGSPLPWHAT